MNIYELLAQKKVWIDGTGTVHELKTMDPDHRTNVLHFLERKAAPLKTAYEWRLLTGPQPSGEMATDFFEAGLDHLLRTSATDWLEEQPLIQKLRKLEKRLERDVAKALRKHRAKQYRIWEQLVDDGTDRSGRWAGDRY